MQPQKGYGSNCRFKGWDQAGGIKFSREVTKALNMKTGVQGRAWGRASSAGQRAGAQGH